MNIKEILKSKSLHIFDMDGTLVNLEELNYSGYVSTINDNFEIVLSHEEYQKFFSGTKTAEAFESYLQSKGIDKYKLDELVSDFREQKDYSLVEEFESSVSLLPFAREYLSELKSLGKTMVLATSTIKPFTQIILEKLEIIQYFDSVITAEDVKSGKPNPEIFNLAVSRFDVEKASAVVYEDSKNGIASAKAAQVLCIGIHTPGLNDRSVKEADYVIGGYAELLD